MVFVYVGLELIVAHLVAWFKFAIIFRLLLNGIIGQMHQSVGQVI